jgi:hypothetical protein
MRQNFEHKGSRRLGDLMNKARKRYAKDGTAPRWCGDSAWELLLKYWDSDEYKKIQAQAKKNRASEKGGVLHTSGRVPHSEVIRNMVCIYL